MWETNVLGSLRMTKALIPALIASGDGLIVAITSVAALEAYDNGAGYTSAKHAQAITHRTLRYELLGKPVRLTEICPAWWRPSSRWCVSTATRSAPTPSTRV